MHIADCSPRPPATESAIDSKRVFTKGWSVTSEPLEHGELRKLTAYGCFRVALELRGCTPERLYSVGVNVYGSDVPVFGGVSRFAFDPGPETIGGISRRQINRILLGTITTSEKGDASFRTFLPVELGTYDVQIWIARGRVPLPDGRVPVCYKVGRTYGDSERLHIRLDAAAFRTVGYFPPPAKRLPRDLRNFEERRFSQFGEDGVIREICARLKLRRGTFVEFGAETGEVGNCVRLAREEGWRGLFIEGDEGKSRALAANYAGNRRIRTARALVTSSDVESLFTRLGVPKEFDVLSIDIDGNDYWVWKAITSYRPLLVVIEYNACYPPPRRWVMAENDSHSWDRSSYFGASLASLEELARRKGYRLIGTTSQGVNAFFLRDDHFDDKLFVEGSVEYHYSRPAYGPFGAGHPYRNGLHLEI